MSKKTKTIDELLEEAIVLKDQRPYSIPNNWVWTKLKYVFNQVKEQIQPIGDEQYIGLEHMKRDGGVIEVSTSEGLKSKKVVFKSGDILYGKLRPYLNKHAYVDFDGVASTDILAFRSNNQETAKLLNMYLGLTQVIQYANENSSGINLPRVSPKVMDEMLFPLPPLKEQKRIADKVERLLVKIDEAKRLIEEARETFEHCRAAILDKAFRADLGTNNYSEFSVEVSEVEQTLSSSWGYKLPSNWKVVSTNSVVDVRDGTHDTPIYQDTGIPLITSKNLKNEEIDFGNVKYISVADHKEISKRSAVETNDILFAMIGTIGNPVLIRNKTRDFSIKNVALFKPNRLIIEPEYLYYYLQSSLYKSYLKNNEKGSTQKFIPLNVFRKAPIYLPPLPEQKRIVEVVTSLLENLNSGNLLIEDVKLRLQFIKQSILSKAFTGELATNNPIEENAIELLKDVLKEKMN